MADSSYILATVHPGSSASAAPLPIRERSGMHASTAVGHAVNLCDWGLLAELLMERLYRGISEPFDVYPNGMKFPSYSSMFAPCDAIGNLWPSYNEVGGRKFARTYLDPSWDFGSERIESSGVFAYSPFDEHALELVFTPMASNRPRALDDLRRRYYDVKRMSRVVVPRRFVGLSEDWNQGFGYNLAGTTPRDYTWAYGSCGSVSVDFSSLYHPDVAGHSGFSATPRYILALHEILNEDADGLDDRYYYLTKWCPIDANGIVDTSSLTPTGCRAVYERAIGATPPGSGESYVRGTIWHGHGGDLMVVYDITFPNDVTLVPWRWEPK